MATDLSPERCTSGDKFFTPQRVDPWRRTRHDVRHPESPFGQSIVVRVADRFGNETLFVQQLPETIREARKVMAGHRRAHAGIDADKQHSQFTPAW